MRVVEALVTCICFFAITSSAYAIWLGPFEMELWGNAQSDARYLVPTKDDPICQAIAQHKMIEMVLEWDESLSDKERKATIKKVILEPYLLGRNREGQLILRGNVVHDIIVKETYINLQPEEPLDGEELEELSEEEEEEKKEEPPPPPPEPPKNEKGVYSGFFRSISLGRDRISTVNIQKVSDIRIISELNFNPPRDWNSIFRENLYEVICSVDKIP